MGIFFKPEMNTCHALSLKDSSQYWQMAAESIGLATERPGGKAILLRTVRNSTAIPASVRTFLPELMREETAPALALAS